MQNKFIYFVDTAPKTVLKSVCGPKFSCYGFESKKAYHKNGAKYISK